MTEKITEDVANYLISKFTDFVNSLVVEDELMIDIKGRTFTGTIKMNQQETDNEITKRVVEEFLHDSYSDYPEHAGDVYIIRDKLYRWLDKEEK